MKKQGMKSARPVHPGGGEVGHLDKTLTEITRTAARRLKRWRTPLIALVAAVIAIQVGLFAVREVKESRQVDLNQQLFDLVQSAESRKEGYVLDASRLEKLLGDVRGDPLEAHIYRTVVQFYLDRAAALRDEAAGRGSLAGDPAGTPDPAREKGVTEAFERAAALAQEAAGRLPGDKDIQVWAGLVKAKVAEEKEASWSKAKRRYAPPPPDSVQGSVPAGTAPATAPAPAEPPPAAPAPPGGEPPPPAESKAPGEGSG